ncbi:hypothetical protein PG993_011254 [Apiospora rasikravindrae]|uniref:Uncharacterized protein n=1 Tax=Apiospora rasikravindrae TaxID=990691 RepID=A0ABR1SDQ3_9PEZI
MVNMFVLTWILLAFTVFQWPCVPVSAGSASPPPPVAGDLVQVDRHIWKATAASGNSDLVFNFPSGLVILLDSGDGDYVLPSNASHVPLQGHGRGWVLPELSNSSDSAWMITANGSLSASFEHGQPRLAANASLVFLTQHRARPYADIHGDGFSLDFPSAGRLSDALAGFYWGTMLPCVIERTAATEYPISEGYVVSTLADKYQGTYPDVDHEFQVKGRVASGSSLDLAVVRRMIELDLRLAREDPCHLWRAPCSLQPDGRREYHIRRNSEDGATNANMFLITGNVELVESVWLYVARTKDFEWLRGNIPSIERAMWLVESHIDNMGRLWSDVYYEDQVMKDGRETMSSALASRSFGLLAQLERLLGRNDTAQHYEEMAKILVDTLAQPLPMGYWDQESNRFVDWVDRSGVVHDHIHLLANILPVMLGATDPAQTSHVTDMVQHEMSEFQRFPTFLSARIANYTRSEIGDGGPYDLCAAGRYWCWDAAYWAWRGRGDVLLTQLETVAEMGRSEDYIMGERYDMDYVYYIDGSPWHGAAHYYEYPCVFVWVMVAEFLGIRPTIDADILVAPRLVDAATIELNQNAYQLRYVYGKDSFVLTNLGSAARTFQLDLSALYHQSTFMIRLDATVPEKPLANTVVLVQPGASVTITPRQTPHIDELKL